MTDLSALRAALTRLDEARKHIHRHRMVNELSAAEDALESAARALCESRAQPNVTMTIAEVVGLPPVLASPAPEPDLKALLEDGPAMLAEVIAILGEHREDSAAAKLMVLKVWLGELASAPAGAPDNDGAAQTFDLMVALKKALRKPGEPSQPIVPSEPAGAGQAKGGQSGPAMSRLNEAEPRPEGGT